MNIQHSGNNEIMHLYIHAAGSFFIILICLHSNVDSLLATSLQKSSACTRKPWCKWRFQWTSFLNRSIEVAGRMLLCFLLKRKWWDESQNMAIINVYYTATIFAFLRCNCGCLDTGQRTFHGDLFIGNCVILFASLLN